jgi:erythromycin esterase
MKRFVSLALILIISSVAAAEPRRHAARQKSWLAEHAHPLATTEAIRDVSDLAPLRDIVGDASVVALADGTHGTHEYFTTKLRVIQFLVNEMHFDTLALEGTFSQMERVNAYVQGEPIDIRRAIFPRAGETDYHFWAVEEFIAVADWMRLHNLRGDQPTVSMVGIDVWDSLPVDVASDRAARNRGMATNTLLAQQRSASGKITVWGHGDHFGKTIGMENVKTAGMWLDEALGARYVAIGNAMGDGVYLGLDGTSAGAKEMLTAVVPAAEDSYENYFRTARLAAFLLSLHGTLDPFLMQPHFLRTAGFSAQNNFNYRVDLPKKFDAIVYVELTTPTHPLPYNPP